MGVDVSHAGQMVDHAYAVVSLFGGETLLTDNATATVMREVCLRQTRGRGVPIALVELEQQRAAREARTQLALAK